MFNKIRIPIIALFLGVGLAACTDADRENAEMEFQAEVHEVRSALASSLDHADRHIEALGERIAANADDAGDEMVQEWQQTLAELREERQAIAREMEGLHVETREAFEASHHEASERMHALDARITEARLETIEARDEFVAAAGTELEAMDRQIADLEMQVEQAGAETAQEYRETLAEIREQRMKLEQDWEQLEQATEEEFRELRSEVISAIASLDREVKEAAYEVRIAVNA